MPIAREGRFLVTHDLAHVSCLGLESSQLVECVQEVRRESFKGVFGCPAFGFREHTLDLLCELPELEAVWFWDVELRSVEALYSLPRLQFFGVHPKRPAIDFARLPALRQAVWFHKSSDTGIASLPALQSLHVWHYRSKHNDFAGFALPESLTELQINWANVDTLAGLPALPSLQRLEIHRCRNLVSLGNLAGLFPRLEHLVVAACGRVEGGEGERIVQQLPGLRHAYVKDRVVVQGGNRLTHS